jgi:DNA-binding CsgD family transcriptional regulator
VVQHVTGESSNLAQRDQSPIARGRAGGVWLDGASVARLFSAMCAARGDGRAPDPMDALTPAERKVIAEVVRLKSKPNKVIAGELGISAHTLRNHLASIYDKLALNRRVDLVLFAMERQLEGAPPGQRARAVHARS